MTEGARKEIRDAPARPRRRGALIGLAVAGAGLAAGVALEKYVYKRVFDRPDPEAGEPIGELDGKWISVESFDGTRIAGRAYGPPDAKVTIVFAHGVLESHIVWHYQVRDLLADGDVRMIAFDARGHGVSGPARGAGGITPFTFYTQSRDLTALVEQATSGRVVLAGHSMGSMMIQALWQHGEIARIRDRVAGIVLINGAYTTDLRGWRGKGSRGERVFERVEDVVQRIPWGGRFVRRVRPGAGELTMLIARVIYGDDPSPSHIAASVRMYDGVPSETIGASTDLATFDAYESLPQIDVPALVIGGPKDVITPLWLSEEIVRRIPDAELIVLDGCGHMAPFEKHADVTSHLRKFVARL